MRRLALAMWLLSACTLDPYAVIDKAALHVHVEGLPFGGTTVVLTARDSAAAQLVKRAPLAGQATVELLFEQGTLAPGSVDLGAFATDSAGKQIACGSTRSRATGMTVTLVLTAANDDANCGGCGHSCDAAPNATRACDKASAVCAPIVCKSGWFDVNRDPLDGCETTCAAPMPESSTVSCRDGVDNDCDEKKDCADEGCSGIVRACSVGTCAGSQSWDCVTDTWSACAATEHPVRACSFGACTGTQSLDCASNTWGACSANQGLENDVLTCSDGLDNDCDTKKDCADETCNGLSRSCLVQTCPGTQDWTCSSATWSTCAIQPGLEATIASCSDGKDNDCDLKTDCQDPDCLSIKQPCGTDICVAGVKTWLCSVNLFSACVPYVAVPENSDLSCGDGLDNDCDGKKDCQDPDCSGKHCGPGKICCANGSCGATCP